MKKIALAVVFAALAVSLSACGSYSSHSGTVADPVPVNESYSTAHYELTDGFKITCISRGSGKSALLSCVAAAPSTEQFTPIAESRYAVNYRKFEDGRVMPCLYAGSGKSAVISCVEQPR